MQYITMHNYAEAELLPKALHDCVDYLRGLDIASMASGTYAIPGYDRRDAYVMVMDLETIFFEERDPEIHRDYIDIQYMPFGNEIIGYAPDLGANALKIGTDPEELLKTRDILFYSDAEHESKLMMVPGSVLILYPWDVHRPACAAAAPSVVRKAVGKVHTHCVF